MKYAIEHENGLWWTGGRWDVREYREEYDAVSELPLVIREGNVHPFEGAVEFHDTRAASLNISYGDTYEFAKVRVI